MGDVIKPTDQKPLFFALQSWLLINKIDKVHTILQEMFSYRLFVRYHHFSIPNNGTNIPVYLNFMLYKQLQKKF